MSPTGFSIRAAGLFGPWGDGSSAESGFIDAVIFGPGKIPMEILDQILNPRGLRKGFMFNLIYQDTGLPALLCDVKADKYMLTFEVQFPNLPIHGKPPLFCILSPIQFTKESRGLPFF
jgi:hypothetical protein